MRDLRCSKKEEKYIKTKILNFVPFQKEKKTQFENSFKITRRDDVQYSCG